jgi:hypothetical protein
VKSTRLGPLKKVVRRIDAQWQELLNYIKHRIANAANEGLNSRIQAIKVPPEALDHSPTTATHSLPLRQPSPQTPSQPAKTRGEPRFVTQCTKLERLNEKTAYIV